MDWATNNNNSESDVNNRANNIDMSVNASFTMITMNMSQCLDV